MTILDQIADNVSRSRRLHDYVDAGIVICGDLQLAEAAVAEARRLETLAEGRQQLGMHAIFMAEIIDTKQMAAARDDYLATFAEAFIRDAFDDGHTTLDALVEKARKIREGS